MRLPATLIMALPFMSLSRPLPLAWLLFCVTLLMYALSGYLLYATQYCQAPKKEDIVCMCVIVEHCVTDPFGCHIR